MPLFSEGFLSYFSSCQFCDMTLVVRKKEYKTHRIILVYSSGYFAQKLADPKYAKQSDPTNLFPMVLRYFYEGRVTITDENCVPLLSLANSLEIADLKKRIATFLSTSINRKNAIFVLTRALEFNTEDVKKKCLLVLARNFSRIANAEPFESQPSIGLGSTSLNSSGNTIARSQLRSWSAQTIVGFSNSNTPSSAPSTPTTTHISSSGLVLGTAVNGRTHKRNASNNTSTGAPGTSPTTSSAITSSATPPSSGLSTSPTGIANSGSGAGSGSTQQWNKATSPWAAAFPLESPFKNLPIGLMLTLLGHVGLAVMNEYLLYTIEGKNKETVDFMNKPGV